MTASSTRLAPLWASPLQPGRHHGPPCRPWRIRYIPWAPGVFRTRDLAVAKGDSDGDERLRLDYLPADCQLLGGDLVVTSGGVIPLTWRSALLEENPDGRLRAAAFAIIAPAVDFTP